MNRDLAQQRANDANEALEASAWQSAYKEATLIFADPNSEGSTRAVATFGLEKTKLRNEMRTLKQKHADILLEVAEDSEKLMASLRDAYGEDLDLPECKDLVRDVAASRASAENELKTSVFSAGFVEYRNGVYLLRS